MKKLLLLGGTRYTIAAVEAAHKISGGVHVITADYLPDNIAHRYSDEYCNVNISDPEAVYEAAKKLNIDGILSFATDPGVIAAAYTANELGLPMPAPYESVVIMQNKDLFRDFLERNGFNVPKHRAFTNRSDIYKYINESLFPIIVKPVDSAGSKGVRKVNCLEELDSAVDYAMSNSISKKVIIEEYIEMMGSQSGSDSFVKNGKLVLSTFDRQYYDKLSANPFTPSAMCYPSDMPEETLEQLRYDIQRAISLLGIDTTIVNVECRLGVDGKPYIMELSPRAGGNRVPEIVRMVSGTDIILNNVKAALGLAVDEMVEVESPESYARVVLHTEKDGIFNGIKIDERAKKYIVELDLYVSKGEKVHTFTGANRSIGLLIMHFPDIDTANSYLIDSDKWIHLDVE